MRKRTKPPPMNADAYGRTLTGLSINLIVRDVGRSLPFYTDVLGLRLLISDEDFAAFEAEGVRLQIHADHTYERMPWASRLVDPGKRGLGAGTANSCTCGQAPRSIPSCAGRTRSIGSTVKRARSSCS